MLGPLVIYANYYAQLLINIVKIRFEGPKAVVELITMKGGNGELIL